VMIKMNVLLILVYQILDANMCLMSVNIKMLATLLLVMLILDANMIILYVMIGTNVQPMNVIPIAIMKILENTLLSLVMIIMLVPKILAVLLLVVFTSILQINALLPINAIRLTVIKKMDVYILTFLKNVGMKISAIHTIVLSMLVVFPFM